MLQAGLSLEDSDIKLGNIDLGQNLVLHHRVAAVHPQFLEIPGDLGVERGALESSNRPGLIGDPRRPSTGGLDDLRGWGLRARLLCLARASPFVSRLTFART